MRPDGARRGLATALGLAVLLLASGCGLARGPSAAEVYADARKNALAASSVRITGILVEGPVTRQLEFAGAGDGSNEHIVVSSPREGRVETYVVDGATYIKADATAYASRGQTNVPARYHDRFVKVPTGVAEGMTLTRGVRDIVTPVMPESDLGWMQEFFAKLTERDAPGGGVTYRLDFNEHQFIETLGDAKTMTRLKGSSTRSDGVELSWDLTFTDWGRVAPFAAPSGAVPLPGG